MNDDTTQDEPKQFDINAWIDVQREVNALALTPKKISIDTYKVVSEGLDMMIGAFNNTLRSLDEYKEAIDDKCDAGE